MLRPSRFGRLPGVFGFNGGVSPVRHSTPVRGACVDVPPRVSATTRWTFHSSSASLRLGFPCSTTDCATSTTLQRGALATTYPSPALGSVRFFSPSRWPSTSTSAGVAGGGEAPPLSLPEDPFVADVDDEEHDDGGDGRVGGASDDGSADDYSGLSDEEVEEILSRIKHIGRKVDVFDDLRKQRVPSTRMYNTVMHELAKQGLENRIMSLFSDMKDAGVVPNTTTYNVVIAGTRSEQGVADVMDEMHASGIEPDIVTYNTLLSKHRDDENVREMEKLFDRLSASGPAPNVRTYTIMVSGLLKDPPRAQKYINSMRDAGVQPDTRFAMAIWELALRVGQLNNAMEMFHATTPGRRRGDMHYKLRRENITRTLEALSSARRMKDLEVVYNQARAENVYLNTKVYSRILLAYAKRSDTKMMEKIFRRMKASPKSKPNAATYNTMIKGYANVDNPRSMMKYFDEMKERNINPTFHTYLQLASHLTRMGEIASFARVKRRLLEDVHAGVFDAPSLKILKTNSIIAKALERA